MKITVCVQNYTVISFMLTLECANKTLCQNYTVIYCRLHRYGTALPEEQLGQHEILRRIRLRALLRMTTFFLQGASPPAPLLEIANTVA